MNKKILIMGLLASVSAIASGGHQTGHWVGTEDGGRFVEGEPVPVGGMYSATVKWINAGGNYEFNTYNLTSMVNCQNHVNAAVGVGAILVTPCHYVP